MATGGQERVQIRTLRGTQVAKVARMQIVEGRVHGRKATARKEEQEQRKGGKATVGHAGRVAKQDTLQLRLQRRRQQELACCW